MTYLLSYFACFFQCSSFVVVVVVVVVFISCNRIR